MAWYPGATRMELQPESDTQPAIRPTQFIVHSIIAPWTAKRTYEYWRDSTNLESHFGLGYEGDLGQFIGTDSHLMLNLQTITENLGEIWGLNPDTVSEVLSQELTETEKKKLDELSDFNFEDL